MTNTTDTIKTIFKNITLTLIALVLGFLAWVYFSTYHPSEQQDETVVNKGNSQTSPVLKPGQNIKVLSWNVQFMAGNSDNHFFYDDGDDQWPSLTRVQEITSKVANLIVEQNPDIVLLQEIDDNAARTHNTDQQAMLNQWLAEHYPYQTDSFYWRASFVPHPKVMGRAGMKLVAFSKYPIDRAIRHKLPEITSDDIITRQFNLKRAVQELILPIANGNNLHVLHTHLSAFAQGSDTMVRQVAKLLTLTERLDQQNNAWLLAGDLNLLASKSAFNHLAPQHQAYYNSLGSELTPMLAKYPSIPSRQQITGADQANWRTYMPADDPQRTPDRTIDYIFYSPKLKLGEHFVIHGSARAISDHLPVVANFTVPSQ